MEDNIYSLIASSSLILKKKIKKLKKSNPDIKFPKPSMELVDLMNGLHYCDDVSNALTKFITKYS